MSFSPRANPVVEIGYPPSGDSMKLRKRWLAVVLLIVLTTQSHAQGLEHFKGSKLYRAKNWMAGNLVRTVFYNYGLVGNTGEISGEWPIGTGDEYVGDVSPLVAVEFVHPSGDTLHAVCTSDGPRGNNDAPPGGGTFWGFEPLPGFLNSEIADSLRRVAVSTDTSTWPHGPIGWPDKSYSDPKDPLWEYDGNDPGWVGSWNGYFGKNVFSADQETYFQMDDHADGEWFERRRNDSSFFFYPDPSDSSRRGLGLRVKVRGLQWAHFLAQDCIFWLYDITNISEFTYDKVAFGMVVGTLSGGRQDSRDDLALFDLTNDITYSWDYDDVGSPGWVPVRPGVYNVGYVGYAFLESPGNPYDGIDNDGDFANPLSPVLTLDVLRRVTAPRSFRPGDSLILIDYNTYQRTLTRFPETGPLVYYIRDDRFELYPGIEVRENGRNGIDDNFNGLIDERYPYSDPDHPDTTQVDSTHLNKRYKDYFIGAGLNDPMIDEARDDGIDNDGDWDPFNDDVGADGVPGTGDFGEANGIPTNGEPNFDKTDVDESDQIGLTSFDYFSPPGALRMSDDNQLWARMAPGHFSVIPGRAEDGDFVYGSGYFPLRPGQTERFSMALLYGEDLADITDNKITVQQIYDQNYNFARPPDKPTLWAVPGDGQVTLYWDDVAERSFERTCQCYDFEGYKIYRSTDPNFNEVFTVTDGLGRRTFHRPIAQFDKEDLIKGFFPIIRNAVIFYLGDDTGIPHSWTDFSVENGQTYYYAITAYDTGIDSLQILPAENNKTIVVDESGRVTLDKNTVRVTPRAPAAGYEDAQLSPIQHRSGRAKGAVSVKPLDPRRIQDDDSLMITFAKVPDSVSASGIVHNVWRYRGGAKDTLIYWAPLLTQDRLTGQARRFQSYYDSLFNRPPGTYDPTLFFKVAETNVFDGQVATMLMPREIKLLPELSGWRDTTGQQFSFSFTLTRYPRQGLYGTVWPADYQIEWSGPNADTSLYFNYYNVLVFPATPVDFRVKNLNRNEYIDFAFQELSGTVNGVVDHREVIILLEKSGDDTLVTWAVSFDTLTERRRTRPTAGDTLDLSLYLNYDETDTFTYSARAARVNAAGVDLDRIRVYPNPYVAVNPQEPSNRYNEGRGERRITFIHLPDRCTIRIYTTRGELVQKIEHAADIDDGQEHWDLRSKDGLNVAYGVYLYHIDSPYGEKTGRFAVIK